MAEKKSLCLMQGSSEKCKKSCFHFPAKRPENRYQNLKSVYILHQMFTKPFHPGSDEKSARWVIRQTTTSEFWTGHVEAVVSREIQLDESKSTIFRFPCLWIASQESYLTPSSNRFNQFPWAPCHKAFNSEDLPVIFTIKFSGGRDIIRTAVNIAIIASVREPPQISSVRKRTSQKIYLFLFLKLKNFSFKIRSLRPAKIRFQNPTTSKFSNRYCCTKWVVTTIQICLSGGTSQELLELPIASSSAKSKSIIIESPNTLLKSLLTPMQCTSPSLSTVRLF